MEPDHRASIQRASNSTPSIHDRRSESRRRGRELIVAVAYLQDEPSPRIMRYREAHSVPCTGDLTDVFPCRDASATIVIADVCGKDEQAHDHARYLRNAVRALADDYSPAAVLDRVNLAFSRRIAEFGDDRFASIFIATVTGRRLAYASAGHDFALMVGSDGRHRHLPPTGAIVGVNEGESYGERTLGVAAPDWLILVTDGITDARDTDGTFFGTEGVARHALRAVRAGIDDPAARILEGARKHGGDRFVDDASVLCVSFS
jgi:serine phosphatase RsbU (regulator of sigma subunit)